MLLFWRGIHANRLDVILRPNFLILEEVHGAVATLIRSPVAMFVIDAW